MATRMVSKFFVYTKDEISFFDLDPKTGLMTKIGTLDYKNSGLVSHLISECGALRL